MEHISSKAYATKSCTSHWHELFSSLPESIRTPCYAVTGVELLNEDLLGYHNLSMERSILYRAGSEDYNFQSQMSSWRCSAPEHYSISESLTQLRFLCLFSSSHAALGLRPSNRAAVLWNKGPRNTGNACMPALRHLHVSFIGT